MRELAAASGQVLSYHRPREQILVNFEQHQTGLATIVFVCCPDHLVQLRAMDESFYGKIGAGKLPGCQGMKPVVTGGDSIKHVGMLAKSFGNSRLP